MRRKKRKEKDFSSIFCPAHSNLWGEFWGGSKGVPAEDLESSVTIST